MSRESIVLFLGLVVLSVPTLGIPADWKQYILMASGGILIVLGYLLRRSAYYRRIDKGNGELGTDSFVESRPGEGIEEAVQEPELHEETT